MYGDSDRLQQVLANLLSNAIKFSPTGNKVSLSLIQANEQIRFEIRDRGAGIPEKFQARIFDKFAQADASDSRQKGGTGLGLSIAKSIVERHGGTIGFTTSSDGTTFSFTLPKLPDSSSTPIAAAVQANVGPRVLICEDDVDIATLLRMMLTQGGYQADIARTASQAKIMLAQNNYAAMTLDLILPDQDGISLIREIRARESGAPIPIVVVSIVATERADEINGDVVGIIDWIQKPIDQQRLIESIRRATTRPTASRGFCMSKTISTFCRSPRSCCATLPTWSAPPASPRPRRCLLTNRYDLILLDITLSDGSGLELLPLLRPDDSDATPVIIFSADEMPRDISQAVNAALVKSHTSNDQLSRTIEHMIERGGRIRTIQQGLSA